jgi:hypothetical protein
VDIRGGLDGVRAGSLRDADRDSRPIVEQASQGVLVRPELDASHVAHACNLPVRRCPDHDVSELVFGCEPPLRVDEQLERRVGRGRLCAEHTRGDLDVLLADGAYDIGRRQLTRCQPVRIEPHPHAVLAGAKDLNAADARDSRQLVLHLQVSEVRQVQHVVAFIGRDEVHDHHQVG